MIKTIKKAASLLLAGCLLVISTAATGLINTMELHAAETTEIFQHHEEEANSFDKLGDMLGEITGTLSRGTAVALLYRVSGEPYINFETVFIDVSDESNYADAIIWAYKNNIVHGFGDGSFKPYDTITNEQFALLLYRYARFLGYYTDGVPVDFPQIPHSSDWAQNAMRWAVYFGWLSPNNPQYPLDINRSIYI